MPGASVVIAEGQIPLSDCGTAILFDLGTLVLILDDYNLPR
jgi:hypothetical protein